MVIRLQRANKKICMKKKTLSLLSASMFALVFLSGCGFVGQQLADKANEPRLLKPGAMDAPLTGYYDIYRFKFLDRYQVAHEWPVIGNCQYSKLPILNKSLDRYKGEVYAVDDIIEQGNSTKQRGAHPKWNFDRFVRSIKVPNQCPATMPNCDWGGKVLETGLKTMCFESWGRTSHSLVLRLHKREMQGWRESWSEYNPQGSWSQKEIGGNVWWLQETAEIDMKQRRINASGGWFQSALLPIGNTGYTIGIQLGASRESLDYPIEHERFKSMFNHLLESVKIEEIKP